MGSTEQGPPSNDPERIAELEAQLRRSEKRRKAAEMCVAELEGKLEERDQRLDRVVTRYEQLLAESKRDETTEVVVPSETSR